MREIIQLSKEFNGTSRADLWDFLKEGGITPGEFEEKSFKVDAIKCLFDEFLEDGVKIFLTERKQILRYAHSVRILVMSQKLVLLEIQRTTPKQNPFTPGQQWTIKPKWVSDPRTELLWSLSETTPIDEGGQKAVRRCLWQEGGMRLSKKVPIHDITNNVTLLHAVRIEDARPSRVYWKVWSMGTSRHYAVIVRNRTLRRFEKNPFVREDHGCFIHLRAKPTEDYPALGRFLKPPYLE